MVLRDISTNGSDVISFDGRREKLTTKVFTYNNVEDTEYIDLSGTIISLATIMALYQKLLGSEPNNKH